MQYFTPLARSSSCVCLILSPTYISIEILSSLASRRGSVGDLEIGMFERRRPDHAARDQRAQVLDHPFEPDAPLFGSGKARASGDSVPARAVHRMGEHASLGAIGVVSLIEQVGAHHLGCDGKHQRGLGIAGVPIL